MWSYYGSKTNVVDFYPKPKHGRIIEPFARYSLKYFENDILLIDKYELLVNIWKWLQQCSVGDVAALPHFVKPGQALSDFTFDCDEAKHLIGFLIGFGMERPRKTASVKRMTMRPNHVNYSLNRIAKNLWKIKHWDIRVGDYSDIENQQATWFVDPPYEFGGHCYQHPNKNINYPHLASWCEEREGQVIVCENTQATWMDFKPMMEHKGSKGMQKEAIWTNEVTHYDAVQTKIFLN